MSQSVGRMRFRKTSTNQTFMHSYEETFYGPPSGFWKELLQLFSFGFLGKSKGTDERRESVASNAGGGT